MPLYTHLHVELIYLLLTILWCEQRKLEEKKYSDQIDKFIKKQWKLFVFWCRLPEWLIDELKTWKREWTRHTYSGEWSSGVVEFNSFLVLSCHLNLDTPKRRWLSSTSCCSGSQDMKQYYQARVGDLVVLANTKSGVCLNSQNGDIIIDVVIASSSVLCGWRNENVVSTWNIPSANRITDKWMDSF